MDRITDRIYLGDINGVSNLYQLRKNKITHILTMAAGIRPLYRKEFKYKVCNVIDLPSQNLLPYFSKAIEFINKAVTSGGRVLVHCFAGVSRSATTVIAYFMATRKMTFMDALNFVKKRRPVIFPNFGFQKQLMEYEKYLKEKFEIKKAISKNSNEEAKATIERHENAQGAYTSFTKRDRLAAYERKKYDKSPILAKKINGQIKPKQFHYPYVIISLLNTNIVQRKILTIPIFILNINKQ
jgi:protein-tyrosine phosphatase